MSQDNNEAASALHSAIMNLPCDESQAHGDPQTAYKYGHRDARHAAAELVSQAASASQSSTPVPRVGGPDEAKTIDTFEFAKVFGAVLHADRKRAKTGASTDPEWMAAYGAFIDYINNFAHVARQRQESAAPNGIKATMRHDAGAIARCSYCGRYSLDPATLSRSDDDQPVCECGKQHGWSGSFVAPDADSKWSGKAPTPSAAVAEGVDTALPEPLTEVRAKFRGEWDYVEAGDNYYNMAKLQAYGAQQREAGRRELLGIAKQQQQEIDALWKRVHDAEAALARQPVSEGLAKLKRFDPIREYGGMTERPDGDYFLCEDVEAILSAVPPAKAEGLTDSARLDFMVKNCAWVQWVEFDGGTYKRAQVWAQNEDEEYAVLSGAHKSFTDDREAIDAAIIAQQAKGEQHG